MRRSPSASGPATPSCATIGSGNGPRHQDASACTRRLATRRRFSAGGVSRDGHYLLTFIQRGWNENDVFFKRLGKDKEWRTLVLGKDAKYGVDVWKDVFYVTTDEGAPNKRVFKVDPAKPERKDWKELIPESKDSTLEGISIIGGHIAAVGPQEGGERRSRCTI